MEIKKVLDKLVSVASESLTLEQGLNELGYVGSPYWNIFCNVSDVIYHILEENTEDFCDSMTWKVLNDELLTHEDEVKIFVQAYAVRKKNRPAQS